MWAIAQEQAATYDAKIKARVAENAKTLRFPYWDWAAQVRDARDVYPSLFEQDMITILKPNGKKDEVENPLYNYKFVGESAKSLKRTVVNVSTRSHESQISSRNFLRSKEYPPY